jgi:hypothetical protein
VRIQVRVHTYTITTKVVPRRQLMHATERCASVNCEPTRKEKAEGVRREQQAKMDVTSASSG